MFLHDFGEDLVLALESLLQEGDPLILGVAGASGRGSKAAAAFSENSFCQR
jgi:hypothetical protein